VRKFLLFLPLMTFGLWSGAQAQFAQPVPSGPSQLPPGDADADTIAESLSGYRGRHVNACGRGQIAAAADALVLGKKFLVYLQRRRRIT
jgi:hypothetical protein